MTISGEAATIKALDQGLFEDLLRRHYRQAYNLAYRMTGNEADAEDLVQEAFLRAYRFFDRYDTRLPFTSWLYRIMTNAHIDTLRRRSRIRTVSLDEPVRGDEAESGMAWELPDDTASPEDLVLSGVLDAELQQGLLGLPAPFRWAVVLADIEGLSYEEIADVMKCSVGTVRSRIHRGRKLLRKHLSPRLSGSGLPEPRCRG
jgi:RNA polymerase sigma-70 factor (ECF subfamily)